MSQINIPDTDIALTWNSSTQPTLDTPIFYPDGQVISFGALVTMTNGDAFEWFADFPEAVEKYAAGQPHDSRGRFATVSGNGIANAGKWQPVDDMMVSAVIISQSQMPFAGTATSLSTAAKHENAKVYQDIKGNRLIVDTDAAEYLAAEGADELAKIQQNITALSDYSRVTRTVVIGNDQVDLTTNEDFTVGGFSFNSLPMVFVRPGSLFNAPKSHLMKLKNDPKRSTTLVHEWGHTLSSRDDINGNNTRNDNLFDVVKTMPQNGGMSKYGMFNSHEMFAEAFVGWVGGNRDLPAVKYIGEQLGWGTDYEETLVQKNTHGVLICDTFEIDNPPFIIDLNSDVQKYAPGQPHDSRGRFASTHGGIDVAGKTGQNLNSYGWADSEIKLTKIGSKMLPTGWDYRPNTKNAQGTIKSATELAQRMYGVGADGKTLELGGKRMELAFTQLAVGDQLEVYNHSSGLWVTFEGSASGFWSDGEKHRLLQDAAELYKANKKLVDGTLTIRVNERLARGSRNGRVAWAADSRHGIGQGEPDIRRTKNSVIALSSGNKSTMAHELGHVIHFGLQSRSGQFANNDRGTSLKNALARRPKPFITQYGTSSSWEWYADTFSEWVGQGGKIKYAEIPGKGYGSDILLGDAEQNFFSNFASDQGWKRP